MRRNVPIVNFFWEDEIDQMNRSMDVYLSEAVISKTFYFRDNLVEKYIDPAMKKKSTQEKIIQFTGEFMDRNNRALSAPGPLYMFAFTDDDKKYLYDLFGLDNSMMIKISKEMFAASVMGDGGFGVIKQGPHRLLIASMMVSALKNKLDDMITCVKYIYGFAEYPIRFRDSWPQGIVEPTMLYTLEHLPGKFKINRMKTLQELLMHDVTSAVDFWEDKLIEGFDSYYIDFIYRVYNQLKATFKNIAKVYYHNHENNNTMHTKAGVLDDGELADQEGHTSVIANSVENSYNKIMNAGMISSMVVICAEQAGVDKSILNNMITQIMGTKDNNMYRMVECIITSFFTRNPSVTSIASREYISYGLSLYRSIGTSKDPLYQEIKSILTSWMNDIADIRKMYSREATIIAYTRAVFTYIILAINYHK